MTILINEGQLMNHHSGSDAMSADALAPSSEPFVPAGQHANVRPATACPARGVS
jgi:hypothetical protein